MTTLKMDSTLVNSWGILNSASGALFITLVTILVGQFYIRTKLTRTARMINKFPGGITLPFLGDLGILFGNPITFQKSLSNYMETHGKTCRLWRFDQPRIMTSEPQVIEKVLSSSKLIEKGSEYFASQYYIGNGLLTADGPSWRGDRKTINPGFSSRHFNGFFKIFMKEANTLVEILSQEFKTDSKPKDVFKFFYACALDIILEAAMGRHENIQYQHDQKYIQATVAVNSAISELTAKPWVCLPIFRHFFSMERKAREYLQHARETVLEVTESRKSVLAERMDDEGGLKPYVDLILQSDLGKNNDKVFDHVIGIVGAGSDTLATSMNFTLFLLALNPQCQKRIQEELTQELNDNMENLTPSTLPCLKYLEMCVKESLRLYTPVPMITRRIDHDVKLDNGLVIPEGCDLYISLYDVHHNAEVFPDPEVFNPERFSKEESSKRGPYDFIPFSAGPRNCIGYKHAIKELIVLLAHVLAKFDVSTEQRREDLSLILGNALAPHPDIELLLKLR